MNNYIKILLIVIFFSSCSISDKKKYHFNSLDTIRVSHNVLNNDYIGMTRQQIVYIFGKPIISDSFDDVYHYDLYDPKNNNLLQKEILNLYFKDNKVWKFNIT